MKLHAWFRAPYDRYLAWKARPQPRRRGVVLLHVEQLEDRTLLNGGGHQAVLPKPPKPEHGRQPPAKQQAADPLYVLDANNDVVLPSNGTPIYSFSNWSMSLEAQVSGASVTSYSWDFSKAPDAQGITGATSYNAQFSWASFTSSNANSDTITLTETAGSSQITQSYNFTVQPTNAPSWTSDPTSSTTWPAVITPDTLSGQAMQSAGPYASLGLADGSVQTSQSLPSYNPNVAPLGLVYNSAVADPQPTFLVRYQLSPTQALPSSVTGQLTLTNSSGTTVFTGPVVSYNPSSLNPGDWMQMALPANAAGLATGRYNWQVQVIANYSPAVTTNYSGSFNLITGSTTPDSQTANPFGAGWSLDNVERLWPVTGGVILQNPDGTSLWFAGSGGTYTTPPGDFSTLTYNSTTQTYTRTLTDGTQITFNSSGQQAALVDRDGNTTSFAYNNSGQLTSVTDMNGQVNTLTYNSSGQATTITDPASRSLTLSINGAGQLSSLTEPDNSVWKYSYDSSNDLTQLTDPRGGSDSTQFTYSGGKVTGVTLPDGSMASLTPVQAQGLAGQVVLAAAAAALYTDPNNNVWTTYLDGLGFGQPVSAADPLGDTSLSYINSSAETWLSADPLGRANTYFFNSHGNVTEQVYPDGSTGGAGMLSYNNFSEVTQYTDPTGAVTTYSYDTKGDLTQVENALLALTTYAYNTAGLVTGMTDALGNHWTYSYDSLNRLVSETDPLLYTQSWSYDTASDVTSYTNQDGFQTTYSYDTMDRKTGATVPINSTTSAPYSYSYDAAGNLSSASTPLYYNGSTLVSATTTYSYDGMDRLTQETDPLGHAITYSYDHAGDLVGLTNALGNTTTYTYDAAGRQTGVTIPLYLNGKTLVTATTTNTYDAAGEVTAVTNPLGQTTDYSYTQRGWLGSVTDPLGNSISYSYDPVGDVTSTVQRDTNNNSILISYVYNSLHLLSMAFNPVAPATTYSYNADNELTSITGYNDGQGAMTYGYDALGRKTSQSDALNNTTSFSYDGVGNLTKQTDPLGYATSYSYDRQGDLLSTTDPLSNVTSYAYNLAGWQTSETDPAGNLTQYSFNAAHELTAETNPLGYQQTFSYDAAGEQTGQTDYNGHTISYSYNLAGWQTGETWLNSLNQAIYQATYSYNNAGQLTGASDPNSAYSYSYDAAGRLSQEVVTYPGLSNNPLVTLTYGYDGFGRRTSLSDSLGGQLTYSYNGNSQLTGLTMFLSGTQEAQLSFSYNSQDLLSGISRTAGIGSQSYDTITSSYSYDGANRITGITYTDATTSTQLASFTYSYNAASQVTSYTGPEGTLNYTYDKIGELTSVSGAEQATYSYGANGNRTMAGYSTGTGNELTSDGQFTYTYDKNGNVLTKTDASGNVWTNTWDYRNRLTEVKETNSSQQVVLDETFQYDVNNNLIGETVNGVQQRWTVYDGANPYMDLTATGQVSERYITDPNVLDVVFARMAANGTTDWYLTDKLGSVREIVGSTGTVEDQLNYDAYGKTLSETNPSSGDRFKYAGGQYDSGLGMYLLGRRWYTPANGGWNSPDPLGLRPNSNPYRYVGNGPTDGTDPTGLLPGAWSSLLTLSYEGAVNILRGALPAAALPQAIGMLNHGAMVNVILAQLLAQVAPPGGGPNRFNLHVFVPVPRVPFVGVGFNFSWGSGGPSLQTGAGIGVSGAGPPVDFELTVLPGQTHTPAFGIWGGVHADYIAAGQVSGSIGVPWGGPLGLVPEGHYGYGVGAPVGMHIIGGTQWF
jgi:RHS repeat-associated protein